MPFKVRGINSIVKSVAQTGLVSFVVCIVLSILPFSFGFLGDIGQHNNQRVMEALCLSVVWGFTLIRYLQSGECRIWINTRLVQWLFAFFLMGVIASFTAYAPRFAFFECSVFLLLLMLAGVIAAELKEGKDRLLNGILLICGGGCVLYLLNVALIYTAVIMSGTQPRSDEFIPGFDNYRFFNHTQTISLSVLVLLLSRSERHRKQYWFWFIIVSLWWAMIIVSSGRGTLVGVIAGVVLTLLIRKRHALGWCRQMMMACGAGACAYVLFFIIVPVSLGLAPFGFAPQVIERTMADPASSRGPLWQLAVALIAEHPLLGVGPAHFAHYGVTLDIAAHPHNWILQIASEWGIVALLCLCAAIYQACRELISRGHFIHPADTANQAALCAWLTIGFSILIDGLVSGLIVMPASQLWIALYLGCAWGWAMNVGSHGVENKSLFKLGRLMLPILSIALILLWCGLYPEILDLKAFRQNSLNLYVHGALRPRIWDAGYF